MKNSKLKMFLCVLGVSVAIPLLTGCQSGGGLVFEPGTVETLSPASTNYVATVATNTIAVAAVTNTDGTITPPGVRQEIVTNLTPVIMPAITFTNQQLTGLAQNTITAAGVGATAAGIPFASLIANALLLALGIAVTWLNQRNKRKLQDSIAGHAETSQALALAQDVSTTLVKNLEQLRQTALQIPGYTPDIDNKVMTVIQQVQEAAGVKAAINNLVDANTGYTLGGDTVVTPTTASAKAN